MAAAYASSSVSLARLTRRPNKRPVLRNGGKWTGSSVDSPGSSGKRVEHECLYRKRRSGYGMGKGKPCAPTGEKDAGLPDENSRDPHKPGESPFGNLRASRRYMKRRASRDTRRFPELSWGWSGVGA